MFLTELPKQVPTPESIPQFDPSPERDMGGNGRARG